MMAPRQDPLLLIASESELSAEHRVWGTGGWMAPDQREALDWLTLARFSGWGTEVVTAPPREYHAARRWIVIGCDPLTLGDKWTASLKAQLQERPLLLVTRGGTSRTMLSGLPIAQLRSQQVEGHQLTWQGPGPSRRWVSRQPVTAFPLECPADADVWLELDGSPIVVSRRFGRAMIASLGFHPSEARDADGAMTAILKHLLIWGAQAAVAWVDFEQTMVLRMDDPGGAQNVYSRSFYYPKLDAAKWSAVGADLSARQARLSIGYTPAWVDDGDESRGTLKIGGASIDRVPGRDYPSPQVVYCDVAGHAPGTVHDYVSEFTGIQTLRAADLAEVELHGFTHMHPDRRSWLAAVDRFENWPATTWFRELGAAAEPTISPLPTERHPLGLGMAAFQRHFGIRPTTLIPPGDQWTNDAMDRALQLGLDLVDSYYLGLRDGDRLCWTTHVCSPYLDRPDAMWFDAGLPVVGYFHDHDLAVKGVSWMSSWLDRWQEVGARRFMDFRELAAIVNHRILLHTLRGTLHLTVENSAATQLVRPLAVHIHIPDGHLPSKLITAIDGKTTATDVERKDSSIGRVILPVNEI